MVLSLPISDPKLTDIGRIGVTIKDLNTLAINSPISIEPSVIIDTECFEEYLHTRILPNHIVQSCLAYLSRMNIVQVDLYLSVYKECFINDTPITVSSSFSNIHNAIVSCYERWFDGKPFSRRTVLHLDPSDTYPAILFQPHRETELATITRHPTTGKLMHSGDGAYIVHCSKSILSETEEEMIKSVDTILDDAKKIIYVKEPNGSCIIRRTVSYPMTVEAKVEQILTKFELGAFSRAKTVSLISPEYITSLVGQRYKLSAKIQHRGFSVFPGTVSEGNAVFQWSDVASVSEGAILLANELAPEDIELLHKCVGAVFSRGGMTSHAAGVSRGLRKICIVGSGDLFIDWENKRAYTSCHESIREGDKICIIDNLWSVGGTIIPNDVYKASCSKKTMEKLQDLLLFYSNTQELKQLPLDSQFHIAKLINALKKSGWYY